jgi:DNA-binding NarL/FixJ family response regulator
MAAMNELRPPAVASSARPFLTVPIEASIKILICESTVMVGELMESALARITNFQVSGRVTDCNQLAVALNSHPDVVLVGSRMSDGISSRALRLVHESDPNIRLILVVEEVTPESVVTALRAGARGIFHANDSLPQLCRCIKVVHSGQVWMDAREMDYVLHALGGKAPMRVSNVKGEQLLSEREGQVVMLVAEGLTNREISRQMRVSEHTIKNHLFRIFDKLGISSRMELLLYVLTPRGGAPITPIDSQINSTK